MTVAYPGLSFVLLVVAVCLIVDVTRAGWDICWSGLQLVAALAALGWLAYLQGWVVL